MEPIIHSDIRAEVLAAALIEKGAVDAGNVVICPTGAGQRSVRRDVLGISDGRNMLSEIGKQREIEGLTFIDVSRPGLYDYLPESFFHEPKPASQKDGLDDTIDEIRLNRVQERAARLVFLTMEKEIYRARIDLELDEKKSMLGFNEHFKSNLFLRIWPQLKQFGPRIQRILFQVLPQTHHLVGRKGLIASVLSAVCDKDVLVEISCHAVANVPVEGGFDRLGNNWLGVNTILGGEHVDFDAFARIVIKDVRSAELKEFLHSGEIRRAINLLADFLFPITVKKEVEIEVAQVETALVVSDESCESYLAFNTVI